MLVLDLSTERATAAPEDRLPEAECSSKLPNLDDVLMELRSKTDRSRLNATHLLLSCCRVKLNNENIANIRRLCEKPVDWKLLAEAAAIHGLTPLLYWNLKAVAADVIPGAVLQDLAESFMNDANRSVILAQELANLLSVCLQNEIQCIPFKGPQLALMCYGNLTLRSTSDLDILVRKSDVVNVHRLLLNRGYTPCNWRNTHKFSDDFFLSGQFVNFCSAYAYSNQEGIVVDLHWQILPSTFLALSPDYMFSHLQQGFFQGKPIETFDNELLLFFLCAHASKHGWYRLNWIVDIAELLDLMQSADWQSLLERSRKIGAEKMVLLGAYLTTYLPRTSLPKEMSDRIEAEPEIRALGDEIINRMLANPTFTEWNDLKRRTHYLRMKKTYLQRFALFLELATKPTLDERMRLPLPSSLFPLYYGLRLLNLFVDHIPRITSRFLWSGYDRRTSAEFGP